MARAIRSSIASPNHSDAPRFHESIGIGRRTSQRLRAVSVKNNEELGQLQLNFAVPELARFEPREVLKRWRET